MLATSSGLVTRTIFCSYEPHNGTSLNWLRPVHGHEIGEREREIDIYIEKDGKRERKMERERERGKETLFPTVYEPMDC